MARRIGWARVKSGEGARREAVGGGPGRIIPILLAVYLTPALLVVLLVGGLGMLVLALARVVMSMVRGPEACPRGPVGPESFLKGEG